VATRTGKHWNLLESTGVKNVLEKYPSVLEKLCTGNFSSERKCTGMYLKIKYYVLVHVE